ncbi:restriction endonuclease [Catalinimonas sp. 4WD22]|uniref:restriction endonuclease n=1 Tax=Catalinimonas locisalis TaxID=3133978 RepID=UPI003100E1B4
MSQQQGNELIRVKQYTSPSEEGTVFTIELVHIGLHAHKIFSSVDHPKIVHEVRDQLDAWEEQWHKLQHEPNDRADLLSLSETDNLWKEGSNKSKEESAALENQGETNKGQVESSQREIDIQEPEALTEVSRDRVDSIHDILPLALAQEIRVDWESLKTFGDFIELPPVRPSGSIPTEYPKEPDFYDYEFRPKLNLIDKTISPLKTKKRDKAYRNFQVAYKKWREMCAMIDKENEERKERYAQEEQEWEKEVKAWEAKKEAFLNKQQQEHAQIDKLRQAYEHKDSAAIIEYCTMVLEKMSYPAGFPRDYKLEYSRHEQCLMLEHAMPSLEEVIMQNEGEQSSSAMGGAKVHLNNSQLVALYNTALCGFSLGILHTLLQADEAEALHRIKFNGWLASIEEEGDEAFKECVISLHTSKAEFMEVKLGDEDPETYFEQLGGLTHTQLHALNSEKASDPEPDSEENQIDASQQEISEEDESNNLLVIPWEEFKGLIMNVFEQEFNVPGGEVKLIQEADNSVLKAIAFDPDPIRGGKIVIYAQREREAIGISIIQTLFKHVMDIKATKGILITTTEYEEDAKAYARDKPVSLLNGKHLISLLDKHGHDYQINFHEIRKVD